MTKKPDPATYADGVGADRCTHCGAVLRHGSEPMVAIRRSDAEILARVLGAVSAPSELQTRLEQAVGRTVKQMEVDK